MKWYLKVLKQYADFSGRARRKEYWMFFLFNIIFAITAAIIDVVAGTEPIFYLLYVIGVFLPGLAVGVRRLHDTGKSGWWFFIALIPLIGSIWLLVLFATDGDSSDNKYGPNPKFDELGTTLISSSSYQQDIPDSDMVEERRYMINKPDKKTSGGGLRPNPFSDQN